jgi:hypothetical protein
VAQCWSEEEKGRWWGPDLVRQVARRREGPGTGSGVPPMEAGGGREARDVWAITGPVAGVARPK